MSRLRKWDDWAGTPSFSSLLESFFGQETGSEWDLFHKGLTVPAVNIAEEKDLFSISMAVPGIKKEEIKINLENNILTISSETRKEEKEEKKNYTRQEFSFSSFQRSFSLPEGVKTDTIDAKYKDGVLTVKIPKKEVKEEKKVQEIKVS
jgi:HSP20 family protein